MQQKNIFLQSEADAWYERNHQAVAKKNFAIDDPVSAAIVEITELPHYACDRKKLKILEIGCGEGKRLAWLAESFPIDVFGIEPSAKAVEQACRLGINAQCGTADLLPFQDSTFDVVIFGFCLYLCDRQDLFRIAQEADRVLKSDAWLVINDFFAKTPIRREYHHKAGVFSHKMDFRTLFDWHPAYTCYSHRLNRHEDSRYTDDRQEWVATSVMRKMEEINV
jgi:ubiquinone/menaquinone biosynthesis C-methylase UbiE